MPCTELALAGYVELARAEGSRDQYASFQGLLQLSASPGGPSIAKLQLSKAASFQVLVRQQPWRRIAGSASDSDLPFSLFAVGELSNGFVAITVQNLWGPKTTEFWVRESALARGARKLDAP